MQTKKGSHNYYNRKDEVEKYYKASRAAYQRVLAADMAAKANQPQDWRQYVPKVIKATLDSRLQEITGISMEQVVATQEDYQSDFDEHEHGITYLDYRVIAINDIFDNVRSSIVPNRVLLSTLDLEELYTGASKFRLSREAIQEFKNWLGQKDPPESEEEEDGTAEKTGKAPAEKTLNCTDLEQKFLITNLDLLSRRNGLEKVKRFQTVLGDPTDIVSVVNCNDISEAMFRITPAQQALLVPKIKLFKVIYPDPDNQPSYKIEKQLPFRNHLSPGVIDNIMEGKAGRGDGVGITDLRVEYTGNNPWSASRLLKVNMTLFFESFSELFTEERIRQAEAAANSGTDPNSPAFPLDASFIDLIWRVSATKKNPLTREFQSNPDYYQIKLVIGWGVPEDKDGLIPPDLMQAIRQNSLSLYLTHVDHNLDFRQDGSVNLNIDYRARSEELLDSPSADIFQSMDSKRQIKQIRGEIARVRGVQKDKRAAPNSEEAIDKAVVALKKREKNLIAVTKQERLRSIVSDLIDADAIRAIDPLWKDFKGLKRLKKFSSSPGTGKASEEATKILGDMFSDDPDALEELLQNASKLADSLFDSAPRPEAGHYRLHYFFLGDLINALIRTIKYENPTMEGVEFLMTSFEHQNPLVSVNSDLIPMESIPISLAYFNDWLAVNVVGHQRSSYYLLQFFKDFFQKVVVRSLNYADLDTVSNRKINYKTQIGFKVFSVPNVHGAPALKTPGSISMNTSPDAPPRPAGILTIGDLQDVLWRNTYAHDRPIPGGSTDYIIFYPYTSEINAKKGDYNEDFKRGIYHLFVGRDSGLVKEINFSKTNTSKLAEANFLAQEQSIAQFFRTYDANVNLYGNTMFLPGSSVYINPSFMSNLSGPSAPNSIFRRFGLGGYYRVNKVSLHLTPDKFVTNITCKWISSGDKHGAKPLSNKPRRNRK